MNEADALATLGWSATQDAHLAAQPARSTHAPARVVLQEFSYIFDDGRQRRSAVIGGRLKHQAREASDLPVVGDWALIARESVDVPARIDGLLPPCSGPVGCGQIVVDQSPARPRHSAHR